MIALWLVLVVGFSVAGGDDRHADLSTDSETGTGESARADERIDAAGLERPAAERILLRSGDRPRPRPRPPISSGGSTASPPPARSTGPRDTPALSTAGGRTVLVQVSLRGDPDDAKDHVAPIEAAVAAVERAHPGVTTHQAGAGTIANGLRRRRRGGPEARRDHLAADHAR